MCVGVLCAPPEHGQLSPGTRTNKTSDPLAKCSPPSSAPSLGAALLASAPPTPSSLGGTHGGMWGAWWGALQHYPSSCPGHTGVHASTETISRFPCSKTSGETAGPWENPQGEPAAPETPSEQGPAPHSEQGHVTGPTTTSTCAGACWASRRQSQANHGPRHSWPVGDPWPSCPAQPSSSHTPCCWLLMHLHLRRGHSSLASTQPWPHLQLGRSSPAGRKALGFPCQPQAH